MSSSFSGFDEFFGECAYEISGSNPPPPLPINKFLLHAAAADSSLRITVTDFNSYTFLTDRTVHQLEDLKDDIGIGGTWPDFLKYLLNSFSSANVKLQLECVDNGIPHAKLTSQIAKGMPRVTFSLERMSEPLAKEATSMFAFKLFSAYKIKSKDVVKAEQERSVQLTKRLSAEKEKNETLQFAHANSSGKTKVRKINPAESDSAPISDTKSESAPVLDAKATQPQTVISSGALVAAESHPPQPPAAQYPNEKHAKAPVRRPTKVRGVAIVDVDDD